MTQLPHCIGERAMKQIQENRLHRQWHLDINMYMVREMSCNILAMVSI